MSLYSRYILPHLIDFAMKNDEVARLRAEHVPAARGVVVEIGIGSGLNLPFYTQAVTKLCGIDPSAELLAMAKTRVSGLPFPVVLVQQKAECLAISDRSVDTLVTTWSLCSVIDPAQVLREGQRILKRDGAFIFVEHGLAPDTIVRNWQRRLTPVWRRVAGGCHLNRKIDDLIRSAGFTIAELNTAYVPGPKLATYIYAGVASLRAG